MQVRRVGESKWIEGRRRGGRSKALSSQIQQYVWREGNERVPLQTSTGDLERERAELESAKGATVTSEPRSRGREREGNQDQFAAALLLLLLSQ